MAVAYIAYGQLKPKVKKRISALLKLNPNYSKWQGMLPKDVSSAESDMYLFMMAATWPDEIKALGSGFHGNDVPPKDFAQATANTGYSDKDMHKYWHFVDEPYVAGSLHAPAVPQANAQVEIAILREALKSKTPDAVKSFDLVWLEHLVGDLHQPLHCVTHVTASLPNGDAGGNSVDITPGDNLHSFWDDVPGSGDTGDFVKAATYAKSLTAAHASDAAVVSEATWVKQCNALAQSAVYVEPIGEGAGPFTITPEYKSSAAAVARGQIALAGARLAKLLNDNLK